MATIKEIAELAGVSSTAVSYALNNSGALSEKTRRRILDIVNEVGYRPNKAAVSLRTSRTKTIGVVAEDLTVFITPEIVDGICEYTEQAGYHIILDNLRVFPKIGNSFSTIEQYQEEITKLVDTTLRDSVDGIIYVGIHYRDVTEVVSTFGKPVACCYCFAQQRSVVGSFYIDDEAAAFEAAEHLIKLGHQKIGVVAGPVDSIPSQLRLRGYQKALLQYNIPINPFYTQVGDWEEASGYTAAEKMFSYSEKPTAIFAMNDQMGYGVLQKAMEMGLSVPEEISIVGFDDRFVSRYCSPRLSTIAPPLRELGRVTAARLIHSLEGKRGSVPLKFLKCNYIERESVASIEATSLCNFTETIY